MNTPAVNLRARWELVAAYKPSERRPMAAVQCTSCDGYFLGPMAPFFTASGGGGADGPCVGLCR